MAVQKPGPIDNFDSVRHAIALIYENIDRLGDTDDLLSGDIGEIRQALERDFSTLGVRIGYVSETITAASTTEFGFGEVILSSKADLTDETQSVTTFNISEQVYTTGTRVPVFSFAGSFFVLSDTGQDPDVLAPVFTWGTFGSWPPTHINDSGNVFATVTDSSDTGSDATLVITIDSGVFHEDSPFDPEAYFTFTAGDSGVTATGSTTPQVTLTGTITELNALLTGSTTGSLSATFKEAGVFPITAVVTSSDGRVDPDGFSTTVTAVDLYETALAGGPIVIPYLFSTTTTDSDPGSGYIRLDNATQNTATAIRLDLEDYYARDWSTTIDKFDDSEHTIKGHIHIVRAANPRSWLKFQVTAVDSSSGYRNVTVSNLASSSASPFSADDLVLVIFQRNEVPYEDSSILPGGRLTLTSATPITSSDVTAATTVYYTPYLHNQIPLYTGTQWVTRKFTETSFSVPASTSTNYDVFAYDSSGALALETLAWSSDTARATALTTQNGKLVKSGDATRLYIGSIRTTTSSGQTEDANNSRLIFNAYNRVMRRLVKQPNTSSWSLTGSTTIRQMGADSTHQVAVLSGLDTQILIELTLHVTGSIDDSAYTAAVGFARSTQSDFGFARMETSLTTDQTFNVNVQELIPLGYRIYEAREGIDDVAATWSVDAGSQLWQIRGWTTI